MKPPGQNILGFDTSSKCLSVAVSDRRGLVAETAFFGLLQHSENLFHLIQSTLESVKIGLDDVDGYAIGRGPGSFTGLRIGFSVLKGFLAACPKPVYGCSSLDLIARGISLANGRLAVLVNARRDRIYAAFYCFDKGVPAREEPEDRVLTVKALPGLLRGAVHCAGDALLEYGDAIRKKNPKAVFIGEEFWYPRAVHLVRASACRYYLMEPLKPGQIGPEYLRLSEPEEKIHGTIHIPRVTA
jgi:tRNA threonylcarbamoyladenosine biosynthesis protein TsaB